MPISEKHKSERLAKRAKFFVATINRSKRVTMAKVVATPTENILRMMMMSYSTRLEGNIILHTNTVRSSESPLLMFAESHNLHHRHLGELLGGHDVSSGTDQATDTV